MAGRNHIPLSGLKRERIDDPVSLHPHRRLTPAEVHIIEERIASQSREIQTLLHDNQRLAAIHVALKQDMAAAQQDLRRLSATASSIKAERNTQVREVYERSLKLEAEARSVDGLSAELDRVRGEIKELRDERKGLSEKLKDIEGDISSTQPELQEFSDLKTEIESWQKEIRRGRAAIECERNMRSNNFELSEAMEKHMISMAHEAEKLRAELANAEQRARTAVIGGAVPVANQGPGYAIQQPGYPNAIQQSGYANAIQQQLRTEAEKLRTELANAEQRARTTVVGAVPAANQGPGYAIQQPGYANAIQQPEYANAIQQPGYAIQQPGYAIQQSGYGENSLSDPHAIQPGSGGNTQSDSHVVQPGTGGNTQSDHHVVQPGYGGNTLSDPHVAHQGEHLNKKEKAKSKHLKKKRKSENKKLDKKGKAEKKSGEIYPMCADCKKNHIGECLKSSKVCFKCKESGHVFYECTSFKEKKLEGEVKAGVITLTQEEAKHAMKGGPICANCKKNHSGECLKGKKVCFRCKEPGHMFYECPKVEEKKHERKRKRKRKTGVVALTQEEAEHVMKGGPICANCKRNHIGECLKGTKVCFRCKEPGHMFYECKQSM